MLVCNGLNASDRAQALTATYWKNGNRRMPQGTAYEHYFYFLNLSARDRQPSFNIRHAKSTGISHFLDGWSRLTLQQMRIISEFLLH